VLDVEAIPRSADAGPGWRIENDALRFGIHERGPGSGGTAPDRCRRSLEAGFITIVTGRSGPTL
jgi:hypothetical protein